MTKNINIMLNHKFKKILKKSFSFYPVSVKSVTNFIKVSYQLKLVTILSDFKYMLPSNSLLYLANSFKVKNKTSTKLLFNYKPSTLFFFSNFYKISFKAGVDTTKVNPAFIRYFNFFTASLYVLLSSIKIKILGNQDSLTITGYARKS